MIPQRFDAVCEGQDAMLANYLAIRLANIGEAMVGANLKITLMECCDVEYISPEEERKRKKKAKAVEDNIYPTHNSHLLNLIKTIVDDLGVLTVEIERVNCADVNLLLRQHYSELKAELCKNVDAQAYRLNRK